MPWLERNARESGGAGSWCIRIRQKFPCSCDHHVYSRRDWYRNCAQRAWWCDWVQDSRIFHDGKRVCLKIAEGNVCISSKRNRTSLWIASYRPYWSLDSTNLFVLAAWRRLPRTCCHIRLKPEYRVTKVMWHIACVLFSDCVYVCTHLLLAELKELEQMLDDPLNSEEDTDHISTAIQHFRKAENANQLQNVNVIGTTFVSSTFDVFAGMKFPLVLVDEASQLMEPLTLVPLARFSCHRLILIGDPLQLPPTLATNAQDGKVGKGLDKTLFNRMIELGHEVKRQRLRQMCVPYLLYDHIFLVCHAANTIQSKLCVARFIGFRLYMVGHVCISFSCSSYSATLAFLALVTLCFTRGDWSMALQIKIESRWWRGFRHCCLWM